MIDTRDDVATLGGGVLVCLGNSRVSGMSAKPVRLSSQVLTLLGKKSTLSDIHLEFCLGIGEERKAMRTYDAPSQVGTVVALLAVLLIGMTPASAVVTSVTVDGSDAIFIAGRSDLLPIPPLDGNPSAFALVRHAFITPEAIVETPPPFIPVSGGDVIRVADPAEGGVSFFNGFGSPFFGPGGNGLSGSDLLSLDGISGYVGPEGPLAGVFLDDSIPSSTPAPATPDFSSSGLGIDFSSLSPVLGQVFYIGDGVTSGNDFQEFTSPAGATRLFLGIPDGFGFDGLPGAYDDNDGAYRVRVGVNEIPGAIPEPLTSTLGLLGLSAMVLSLWRRSCS